MAEQQRPGARQVGRALLARADGVQQRRRGLEQVGGLLVAPLPQPQQAERLHRRRPAPDMAGLQLGGGRGGEFDLGLVVLLQLDQGEGELGVHPAGDPAAGVQRLGRPHPGTQRGQQLGVVPGLQLQRPQRLAQLPDHRQPAELLGRPHRLDQVGQFGGEQRQRRPRVGAGGGHGLGVARAEVPTSGQRGVVGADGEPEAVLHGPVHRRGAGRDAVLGGSGPRGVPAHGRTVAVAAVLQLLQQLLLGQFGQDPPGPVRLGAEGCGSSGGVQEGPWPDRQLTVAARQFRVQLTVERLGGRAHRVAAGVGAGPGGSRSGKALGPGEDRQPGGRRPQGEGRSAAAGQHRGQRGPGGGDRLLAREVGQQPHRVLVGQRPDGDPDGVQAEHRATGDHDGQHRRGGTEQWAHLGRRVGVVEHDQQPPVGDQGAEQRAALLDRRRDLVGRNPELPEEGAQHGGGGQRALGGVAAQVGVELAVGEPLDLAAAPVDGERAGADALGSVQQRDPGPSVGLARGLPVELLHGVLTVREEPGGDREAGGHRGAGRRLGRGLHPLGHRLGLGRAAPRGLGQQTGQLLALGGPGRGRDLVPGDSAGERTGRSPGPLAGLAGYPAADGAEHRHDRRDRGGIHHSTPPRSSKSSVVRRRHHCHRSRRTLPWTR